MKKFHVADIYKLTANKLKGNFVLKKEGVNERRGQ